MLTKTLNFEDDVLSVLRAMEWNAEGLLGILPPGQLERKLYERVNKALEALDGKWNRKAKGHIFQTDPRPQFTDLLDTGQVTVHKDGFFETQLQTVKRMIELVLPRGTILEPEAGLGAIVDNLGVAKDHIDCIEKNPQRADVLWKKGYAVRVGDFLLSDPANSPAYDCIYMNPPFEEGQDIDHVRHAYQFLRRGGSLVSVMSEGPWFRQDRKHTEFREWVEGVGGEVEKLPAGSFKDSGTMVNARLVLIRK